MGWPKLTIEFGPASQGALDRLSQTIALLVTAIQQTGNKLMTVIDDLAASEAAVASAETALAAVVTAAVTSLQTYAKQVADLTAQLAAAQAAGNTAAISAVVTQLNGVATKLSSDASTLQGAIPVVPPAGTPTAAA